MMREQYKQAYGLIRYANADYENYDYAPRNVKYRDVGKEHKSLHWLALGAAHASLDMLFWCTDPLKGPNRYLALCMQKERKRADAERRKRQQNSVTIPKAEYNRLLKGQKKAKEQSK